VGLFGVSRAYACGYAAPYNFGTGTPVPVLRYNNFGFAVGGPILRRKMFFYFDFDKTIDNGGANTAFNTMPTDALKKGDFTGAGLPTLYDQQHKLLS